VVCFDAAMSYTHIFNCSLSQSPAHICAECALCCFIRFSKHFSFFSCSLFVNDRRSLFRLYVNAAAALAVAAADDDDAFLNNFLFSLLSTKFSRAFSAIFFSLFYFISGCMIVICFN
jgi:hypothetical protein